MRVVIHPGFHKTGTKSVQHLLKSNRGRLRPYLRPVLRAQMRTVVQAARGYSTWRDPFTLDKFSKRFQAVLEHATPEPGQTLCLSAEELSGHLPGRDGIDTYDAAPVLARDMITACQHVFPEAEIALSLSTRENGWLLSAYWEHVKSSSMTMGWEEFAATYDKADDLARVAAHMQDTLPCPVHVTTLETSATMPAGPATPLLRLCGVPEDRIASLKLSAPRNQTPKKAVLLALLAANRDYPDPNERQAAKQAILAAAGDG